MQHNKTGWIQIGDFLFKYRNKLFPLLLAGMFFGFKPSDTYFGNNHLVLLKDWIAIITIASGLICRAVVIGFAYIKRGGLAKRVYADDLVKEGGFAVCRNPLYIGNMLIYSGMFLMHGNPYVVVIGSISFFVIYQSIISAEEYFLHDKFGDAYNDYCHNVPRWLPKISQFRNITEGMNFNLKRVIMKDYPTIANAIIVVIVLKLLKNWHVNSPDNFIHTLVVYGSYILAVVTITALIALVKRYKIVKN